MFDIKPSDIFWCTADIGWVTGHSYIIYGPMMNAATIVLFEGIPTYPAADRFWRIVEKYKVNIIYTASYRYSQLDALWRGIACQT